VRCDNCGDVVRELAPANGSAFDHCIVCPEQVRNLHAVAFNFLNLVRNAELDPDRMRRKLPERIAELQEAVDALEPFMEAHFANKQHSEKGYKAVPRVLSL